MDQISRLAVQGVASINCRQTQAAVGWLIPRSEQLTLAVADEEDDVERPEGEGLHHEKVGRPDISRIAIEEGPQALPGR